MNKFSKIYGYNPLLMTQRQSARGLIRARLERMECGLLFEHFRRIARRLDLDTKDKQKQVANAASTSHLQQGLRR